MRKYHLFGLAAGALALAAAHASAEEIDYRLDEMPEYRPEKKIHEIIRIAGFNPVEKLFGIWEEGFKKYHPDVRFEYDYSGKGSQNVPARLYTMLADLGLMRELWRSEALSFYRVFSADPVVIDAATGSYNIIDKTAAMIVIVHKDNPISQLTMKQLDGIFGESRTGGYEGMYWSRAFARGTAENIRTWGQLGLTGEWADKPIQVYGQDLQNGFAHYFAEAVLHGGNKWNPNLYEFGFSISKEGPTKGEMGIDGHAHTAGSAPLVNAIAHDRYGIGYCIVRDQTPAVKVLALAKSDSNVYIEASKASLANRTYPLTRSIYWTFHRVPGEPVDPKLKEYLRYVLSREGQAAVVREGEWIPLTPELVKAGLKKLE